MSEEQHETSKPLTYKDNNGDTLYGMKDLNNKISDLNENLDKQRAYLKKYYGVALTFAIFLMLVILWVLWQVKRYKVISLVIDALKN